MTGNAISAAVVAAFGAVVGWLKLREARSDRRAKIRADQEILAALPESSAARDALSSYIDAAVKRLIEDEETLRRDPLGISLGVAFLAIAGVLVFMAFRGGWWWFMLAAGIPVAILGAAGLATDATKKRRDP